MPTSVRIARVAALAVASLLLVGCVRGCTSSRPPIHLNPNMDYQPKYQPQESSEFFYDGMAMREPVAGTVHREALWPHDALHTGRDEQGAFVLSTPLPIDAAMLARGAERFEIYCAPCHETRGDGRGILYQRGKVPTPSLHDERIRALGDGEIFDVITNGKGLMSAYRWPIEPHDRWAIIAHLRELQRDRAAAAGGAP